MSNLLSMMHTGVSGIQAAQVQIDVTGHNLANIDNPNYSRQRVNLAAVVSSREMYGAFGRGVKVTEVIRVYDDVLAKSLRNEMSSMSYWGSHQNTLGRIGIYFNEFNKGSGLGESMKQYFNSWSDLAALSPNNSDQSYTYRQQVVANAQVLATQLRDNHAMFKDLQRELDGNIKGAVDEINSLSASLATLNAAIVRTEVGGKHANDLRDQREAILNKMSTLAGINAVERQNGEIAVYIAGSVVVDGSDSYKLIAEHEDGNEFITIRWGSGSPNTETTDITDRIVGGQLQSNIEMRDKVIPSYIKELDDLAYTLVFETNRAHVSGQGLERVDQLTSTNGVTNPSLLLSRYAGDLPYEVKNGSFQINLYDSEGKITQTYSITVDPYTDNMNSIAQKISEADGNSQGGHLQATVNKDGTLSILVNDGFTFAFGNDTSDFLIAAGFNGFFKGTCAATIDVDERIVANPKYISTSEKGAPGDNSVAKAIADVKFKKLMSDSSITLDEFYSHFAGKIAGDKKQADIFYATRAMAAGQYADRLEQIKGVSMEEEQTNLLKFQRVFEANSRYVNVIDQMLDTIINRFGLAGR